MEVNTASLIFQKLTDPILSRVLSLTSILRPNDFFWQQRFEEVFKVELGPYAKMTYYDIYRELISDHHIDLQTHLHTIHPLNNIDLENLRIINVKKIIFKICGKNVWLHLKIVQRGYLPFIERLIAETPIWVRVVAKNPDEGSTFLYLPDIAMNSTRSCFFGPLSCSALYGHLDLVKYFSERMYYSPPNESFRVHALIVAIKSGHLLIVKYLLESIYYNILHNTLILSNVLHRLCRCAIVYNQFEIFDYIYETRIVNNENIDTHKLHKWLFDLAIKLKCPLFIEHMCNTLGVSYYQKYIEDRYRYVPGVNKFGLKISYDHMDDMVEDIIQGRSPHSSRRFLSLFRLFGSNVELYRYLLVKYPKLPSYFLHKVIMYHKGERKVLEMIFELHPELYDQWSNILNLYKGNVRGRKQSILPLMTLLVAHRPSMATEWNYKVLLRQAYFHKDMEFIKYLQNIVTTSLFS